MSSTLIVYGAAWCGDTNATRRQLDTAGIAYTYVELEDDPAAATWVRSHNDGAERKPTLRLQQPGHRDAVLAVPDKAELTAWLSEYKVG